MPQCLQSYFCTRSSNALLLDCPPAPPEVGESPVLLLELRLESLELLSNLSRLYPPAPASQALGLWHLPLAPAYLPAP